MRLHDTDIQIIILGLVLAFQQRGFLSFLVNEFKLKICLGGQHLRVGLHRGGSLYAQLLHTTTIKIRVAALTLMTCISVSKSSLSLQARVYCELVVVVIVSSPPPPLVFCGCSSWILSMCR
jgi:hypothetical protein